MTMFNTIKQFLFGQVTLFSNDNVEVGAYGWALVMHSLLLVYVLWSTRDNTILVTVAVLTTYLTSCAIGAAARYYIDTREFTRDQEHDTL